MRKSVLAAALLLAGTGPALAAPANLPPEEAVIAALDGHPGVIAADARIDSARAGATMLRKGTHEVTLSGTYVARDIRAEGRYDEFDGTISRAFRLPGKAALDRQAGLLGIDVAKNRRDDMRHQTSLALAQMWFDWLGAGETYRTDMATVAVLEQALHAVERRSELRDAAKLDVEQARAALDQARGMAAATLAMRDEARIALASNFPDLPLPPAPPELGQPEMPAMELGKLRDLIIERSHEIRAADREAARLGTMAQRARRDRFADPTIGLRGFSERGGNEQGGGIVVSIPLGGGYRKAAAEQAEAEASAGLQELASARRTIEAMADGDLAAARGRMSAWQSLAGAARSAQAAADRTARGQELGAIDLAEALLARRLAHDAQRQEIAARADAIRALIKLQIDAHMMWMTPGDVD